MAVPIPSITGGAASLSSGLSQGNISIMTGGGKKGAWIVPALVALTVVVVVPSVVFLARR